MVLFNYSTRELTAKIVYYGPGLCGKTTNLQFIFDNLPTSVKGKMLSLATKTDRTLFFDFLPLDLGEIRGMKTRIQLYTVPGQVFYNETRRLVLKGADGVVFVADSQKQMLDANVDSFRNLEENLRVHSMKLAEMPLVFQYNKRDLPHLASIEEMNTAINSANAPFYESVATTGIGVQDTLKAITKLVLLHLTKRYDTKKTSAEPVGSSIAISSSAASTSASTGAGLTAAARTSSSEAADSSSRASTSTTAFDEGVEIEEEVLDLTEEYEEPEAVAVSADDDAEPIELLDEVEESVAVVEADAEQVFDIEEVAEEDLPEVPHEIAARSITPTPAGVPPSKGVPARPTLVRDSRPAASPGASHLGPAEVSPAKGSPDTSQVPRIILGQEHLITVPVDIEMNGSLTRFNLSIALRITRPPRST